jgi:3-oxoacyl-[acyl-carrier protein] reductase
MELSGARVLVTGGSEGIGYAIASALIAKGARVAIMARREGPLEKAAMDLGALAIPGDVSVEADAIRAVDTVTRTFGGIDVLVNNAGIGRFSSLVDTDLARFHEVFSVNVVGAMLMAREAARHFILQKKGHLINISSTSGMRGGAGAGAYSGSKFALRGMTECWRDELRRYNVRVTLVSPSEVQTEFGAKAGSRGDREPSPKKLRGKEIADAIIGALEMDDRGFIPEFAVWATNPF